MNSHNQFHIDELGHTECYLLAYYARLNTISSSPIRLYIGQHSAASWREPRAILLASHLLFLRFFFFMFFSHSGVVSFITCAPSFVDPPTPIIFLTFFLPSANPCDCRFAYCSVNVFLHDAFIF